jgi:hypothetical protein
VSFSKSAAILDLFLMIWPSLIKKLILSMNIAFCCAVFHAFHRVSQYPLG